MSKLKVYVPQDVPYGLVPEEGGAPVEEETFYLKSEVDKLIAEKDTKIIQLEALIDNYNRISEEIIDNANHQKYRRCLNNAWWILREEFFAEDCHVEHWVNWAIRWYKRWMELAKQFKEAASGNPERAD